MTGPKAITCPVCENLCSSQAAACPKCGHPIARFASVEKVERPIGTTENEPNTGLVVLWILVVVSGLYALLAIPIGRNKPYSAGGLWDREIADANFAILYHVAPFVIMIILLAIVYAIRGKR